MFPLVRGQTSLSISPLQTELGISPGKNKQTSILIGNDSFDPVKINIKVESWHLDKEGTPIFNDSPPFPFSCKDWIEVESGQIDVGAGRRKEVPFKVSVPNGITPGHYWAAVSFEPQIGEESDFQGDGMHIQQKIITGVFIKVGKVKPAGKIIDILSTSADDQNELIFSYENTGRSYFFTSGQLEIKDERGRKILKTELPGELILPESTREVRFILDEKLSPGKYSIICSLEVPAMKKVEFKKELEIK